MAVSEVAPGVWRAGSRWVNWYLVDAGSEGWVLVDAGLPRYRRNFARTLNRLGRQPADVKAVVLTHGHIDHVGMVPELAAAGATVFLHDADAGLASQPRSNQTERPISGYLTYPATVGFVAHAILNGGGRRSHPMPDTSPLTEGINPSIPAAPVVTHTPGHTDGSCVIEFREHGVAFVGDLLCTASPTSGRNAPPQVQTRASNRNSKQALASLERLTAIDASVILPGHGEPWEGGVEAAVHSARRIGCR